MIRNPKQEGTRLFDCVPQTGLCPMDCNQCFYNRPGAWYADLSKPLIPSLEELALETSEILGDPIVRMNSGHDSGLQKGLVLQTAEQYKNVFFNTSRKDVDFPGPVVVTVNPREEDEYYIPRKDVPVADNLIFVRLRVSASNLKLINHAVARWAAERVPVVLTFMAYYELSEAMKVMRNVDNELNQHIDIKHLYEYKKRHINDYYCPSRELKAYVMERMKRIGGRFVTMCGTIDSNWCRDCLNCETYYLQTIKHMKEKGSVS